MYNTLVKCLVVGKIHYSSTTYFPHSLSKIGNTSSFNVMNDFNISYFYNTAFLNLYNLCPYMFRMLFVTMKLI